MKKIILLCLILIGAALLWIPRGPALPPGLTFAQITNPSSSSGGTWGSITGTLSSQTDLQTALNLLAPLANPTFTGTVTAAAVTTTGIFSNSQAGALSAAAVNITGAPITGGTATTTFPLFYFNSGAAPSSFSTAGTVLGINAPSGFAGRFFDLHVNGGASVFSIDQNGSIASSGAIAISSNISGAAITGNAYKTTTNCAAVGSAASPSVAACTAAPAGAFSCATNASGATCQVNTTIVTANSEIQVWQVVDEGTRLSVTCNTASVLPAGPLLASKSAGASFTINLGTVTTNPGCFDYTITN